MRIYGNTAVTTGRFTARGLLKGKSVDIRERDTAVWVKRNGRWQMVAQQGNAIKQYEVENIRPLCYSCNSKKGDRLT